MLRSTRLGLLSAALLATTTAAATGLVAPAEAKTGPSVSVHGRLVVVPAEAPGGQPAYGVALADGDIVSVRGTFDPDVRTGAVFDGWLRLPAGVVATLSRRGESGSSAALQIVDRRSLSLPVLGTASITAAADAIDAVVPTTHQQYVAALDNKGSLGQSDAALLGHVSTVGSYWQGESNGAINGIGVPATVKHYNTALSTTDCGLGDDFFDVVQEALGKFPGIHPFTGSDQLLLFVPSACQSGGVVGEGTIGSSFASGGALVVKAGAAIDGTYAHETGHNYGFEHANARWSGTSMEYYGIYDVMGFALNGVNQLTALSTPFRVFQGITDAGEIQDVPLGDQSTTVHASATIEPRSDDTGMRSVRVVDPDSGEPLYLDYRSGTGQDAGSAYVAEWGLGSNKGTVWYAPGVTINAARGGSGVDTLVVDGGGDTSLGNGATWTNGSGTLSVHVTSLSASGAGITVDFTPPQDFASVGTPVIGGDVSVGGSVSLDTGTWTPTPTATTIRWTADGSPVANTNDKTSFVPAAGLAGKQLVATVTAKKLGYKTTSVQSGGVIVAPGTISTTANPSISGTPKVGFTLHASTGTWNTVLSPITTSYQWQRDGVDIPGGTGADYQVVLDDVGSAITVVQTLDATGYETATLTSSATDTVPEPVIDPAPTPILTGSPRVGTALHVTKGTWMVGTDVGYQWFVAGVPVGGATGTSYTPTAGDLGKTVRVAVTGTRTDYPTVTRSSTESAAVSRGVLNWTKPVITGNPTVGRTLKAQPGFWTAGTAFSYAWYASGKQIKHQSGAKLKLTKAQKGKRITVKVTGKKPGYTSVSKTSAKTLKVG